MNLLVRAASPVSLLVRAASPVSLLVRAASLGAALLAVHTAVNARLLRTPPDLVTFCRPARGNATSGGGVSVLVPARDEAQHIGECVRALLASQGVEFELLVLDDGSTDGTAEIARAAADADPRLRVLSGSHLPDGWLGKPHACAQLAAAADGRVLVFVDADVVVAPDGLARTLALLDTADLDLVSPYPRQLTGGVAERLVQPLLQWSWLTFLPLRLAERCSNPALVAANGQLLACRAAAYRGTGGHAAVRGEVLEDVALARVFKRAGYRATVADGTTLATCRMYDGWAELRDGYSKSLWAAFGSPAGRLAALGLLAWLYLLPPAAAAVALARRRPARALWPVAGYAAGVAGRVAAARRTGGRTRDAAAHPVSIALLLVLAARSQRQRRAGQLAWKGRALPPVRGG